MIVQAPRAALLPIARLFAGDERLLPDLRALAAGGCDFLTHYGADGALRRGMIAFDAERPAALLEHCLIEEMAQAQGLPNDDYRVTPSLFNDGEHWEALTQVDSILLRTLYDARVPVGASRAAALRAARPVIRDLLGRTMHLTATRAPRLNERSSQGW